MSTTMELAKASCSAGMTRKTSALRREYNTRRCAARIAALALILFRLFNRTNFSAGLTWAPVSGSI
jgi:hypothetical protein